MTFFLANIEKELKRRFNDPWALFMWLAVPFLVGLLLIAVIGDGARPRARLLVTNLDDSFVSDALPEAFKRDELAAMVELEEVGEAAGRALMEEGAASAHLVIPQGFGDDYLARRETALRLTVNPAQRISPRLVRDVLESMLDLGNYLHLVFPDELKAISEIGGAGTVDEEITAGISADISRRFTRLGPYLFPPAIEVEDITPVPVTAGAGPAVLMFPGILIMAVFFAGNGIAGNFWTESDKGTFERWRASPNRLVTYWGGQFVSAALLLGLVSLPILVAGFLYIGIAFAKLAAALLWLMLAGPLLFAFLLFLQALAPSSRSANMISTLVMFPLLMAGGSFFPSESMPDWLAPLADYTPNGRILEPLKQYFLGTYGASGLFREIEFVLAATLGLILLASLRVEQRWRG